MNTQHLEEFLILARELNCTIAAQQAFVAGATLIEHMGELESELGCRLFARSEGRYRLTPIGRRFVRTASGMLENVKTVCDEYRDLAGNFLSVRIAATNLPWLETLVHRARKALAAENPRIVIEITPMPGASSTLEALSDDDNDIVVCGRKHWDGDVTSESIPCGFDGFKISNSTDAPLLFESGSSITLVLKDGSENAVTDLRSSAEENKAAIYTKSDLTISGNGTLDVTGTAEDAIHSKTNVTVQGGTINLKAGDDAIHADETLTILDGKVTVLESEEGLEGLVVDIQDGDITVNASDDGLNASDGSGSEKAPGEATEGAAIRISGGVLTVKAGGDGIDSNGDLIISGGTVVVDGPSDGGNAPIDYDGKGVISGGTVFVSGDSGMFQSLNDSGSTQNSIVYYLSETQAAGTKVAVADSKGNVIYENNSTTQAFNTVLFSAADLKSGENYTVTVGEQSETVSISDTVNNIGENRDGDGPQGGMNGGFERGEHPERPGKGGENGENDGRKGGKSGEQSGTKSKRPERPESGSRKSGKSGEQSSDRKREGKQSASRSSRSKRQRGQQGNRSQQGRSRDMSKRRSMNGGNGPQGFGGNGPQGFGGNGPQGFGSGNGPQGFGGNGPQGFGGFGGNGPQGFEQNDGFGYGARPEHRENSGREDENNKKHKDSEKKQKNAKNGAEQQSEGSSKKNRN